MKQTLVKNYVYEAYTFTITVILNSKESEKTYIHEVTVLGKDYFSSTECTSDSLQETIDKVESNIIEFVNAKLSVSDEENYLLSEGFVRVSY